MGSKDGSLRDYTAGRGPRQQNVIGTTSGHLSPGQSVKQGGGGGGGKGGGAMGEGGRCMPVYDDCYVENIACVLFAIYCECRYFHVYTFL